MVNAPWVSLSTENKDFWGTRKNLEECRENAQAGHLVSLEGQRTSPGEGWGRRPASQAAGEHGELRKYTLFDIAEVKSLRGDC